MPILSPTQLSALRLELAKAGYAALNRQQAADELNRPLRISNGTPAQVPIPLSTRQEEIFSVFSSVSVGKMSSTQLLDRALNHIETNNHAKFLLIVVAASKGGIITGQEALELDRLVKRTQADPNHIAERITPSTFQGIAGLGDVDITHPDGRITRGTCYPEFIDEARAA